MANQTRPGTSVRTVRLPDALWLAVVAKANTEGRTAAEVIRALLAHYVDMRPEDIEKMHGARGGSDHPS